MTLINLHISRRRHTDQKGMHQAVRVCSRKRFPPTIFYLSKINLPPLRVAPLSEICQGAGDLVQNLSDADQRLLQPPLLRNPVPAVRQICKLPLHYQLLHPVKVAYPYHIAVLIQDVFDGRKVFPGLGKMKESKTHEQIGQWRKKYPPGDYL